MAEILPKMKTGLSILGVVILSAGVLAALVMLIQKLFEDEDKQCPRAAASMFGTANPSYTACRILQRFDTSKSGLISRADLQKLIDTTGGEGPSADDVFNVMNTVLTGRVPIGLTSRIMAKTFIAMSMAGMEM